MNKLFADEVSTQSAVAAPSSERHAALLLHAMGEADRDWALARLQPVERARLVPLLEELRELGVPAERSWVAQLMEAAPAPVDTPRQLIATADAQRVSEVLMIEPARLVQRLLALGPWPWQEAVVATLRARRGELFEPADDGEPRACPALNQALLDRVALRLGSTPRPHAASAPADGAWARWRRRLGGWQGRAR